MDAVKYLQEANRMCNTIRSCDKCPFGEYKDVAIPCKTNSQMLEINNPKEAVQIVEKWALKHPAKTRQSEFLKIFPNAQINNGYITICPKKVNENSVTDEECRKIICSECLENYWLTEVE